MHQQKNLPELNYGLPAATLKPTWGLPQALATDLRPARGPLAAYSTHARGLQPAYGPREAEALLSLPEARQQCKPQPALARAR
eukprot:11867103-Alexandrium_andersonii.AAC.1